MPDKPADYEERQAESYPVIVHRRADGFVLVCDGLGLVEEAASLEQGWQAIDAVRNAALSRYERAGLAPPPMGGVSDNSLGRPFWIKTGVIGGIIGVVFILALIPLNNAMVVAENAIRSTQQVIRAQMSPRQLGQSVEKLAELMQKVTPSRREELRAALRLIARELEPYAAELRPLVLGPGVVSPQSPKQKNR
jgi:hypothetical protein